MRLRRETGDFSIAVRDFIVPDGDYYSYHQAMGTKQIPKGLTAEDLIGAIIAIYDVTGKELIAQCSVGSVAPLPQSVSTGAPYSSTWLKLFPAKGNTDGFEPECLYYNRETGDLMAETPDYNPTAIAIIDGEIDPPYTHPDATSLFADVQYYYIADAEGNVKKVSQSEVTRKGGSDTQDPSVEFTGLNGETVRLFHNVASCKLYLG